MKWDCFYEGLNPKYRQMLAHKVDGKNPAGYSDLLLAMRKLEKRAEARDLLPPKTAMTSVSNVTFSQISGNLFPWCKLKGNHTFTAWAVTIGSNKVEEDRLQCEAGRGWRDRICSWQRGQNIRWSRNRSTCGVYHSFHQGDWTIPTEKQKLFWV